MKIKPIQEAPPNKTTTKILLKGADEEGTYLEVTEDITNIQDLYFEIQGFMQQLKNMNDKVPVSSDPVSCCYNTKKGYIIIVTIGCVVKWLDRIYTEGETLGIIKDKDREMI